MRMGTPDFHIAQTWSLGNWSTKVGRVNTAGHLVASLRAGHGVGTRGDVNAFVDMWQLLGQTEVRKGSWNGNSQCEVSGEEDDLTFAKVSSFTDRSISSENRELFQFAPFIQCIADQRLLIGCGNNVV
jgi:hypothetical protein